METRRASVPLSPEQREAIARARSSGVLAELTGPEANRSEASAIQAVIELGLRAVQDQTMAHGYAALAASMDPEDHAHRTAIHERRRAREARRSQA